MGSARQHDDRPLLDGKRVAFVGKLGGVNRREAQRLVREHGGVPVDRADAAADLIVIGADELPLGEYDELLDEPIRRAAAQGALQIITETQFWERLGLVESDQNVRRLYTPAMLADLLHVPLAVIRRWNRRGLIVPARVVRRLPYFDFQEVATARRLAQLLAAGASPSAIEKKLAELARFVPQVDRPLAQLSVIVQGQQLLLRQGEGLIEPGGQLRIDFEALEAGRRDSPRVTKSRAEATLRLQEHMAHEAPVDTPEQMLEWAAQWEEEGELELAIDLYRAVLAASGAQADVCFQLAELLYRLGDVTAARERYYAAIELDEDYVEARANLGCVLAETGRLELAVAAFQGALRYHPDYPDAHYHLARTLDDLGRGEQSRQHWAEFLALAPESPWADEARARLGETPR